MATRAKLDIMSVSWRVQVDSPSVITFLTHDYDNIAILILPGSGFHSIALESDIRPYRAKTRHSSWTFWAINLDVLLWALHNLLGTRAKVSA